MSRLTELVLFASFNIAVSFALFFGSYLKAKGIAGMAKAGLTPVYHDFLVQTALMGAGMIFGALGLLAIGWETYNWLSS